MRYVWELTADWKWRWKKQAIFKCPHGEDIQSSEKRGVDVSIERLLTSIRIFAFQFISRNSISLSDRQKERKKFLLSTVISFPRGDVLVNQQENEKRKLPILGLQSEWTGMHSVETRTTHFFSRLLSSLYRIAACNLNFSARELDNIQISSLEKEKQWTASHEERKIQFSTLDNFQMKATLLCCDCAAAASSVWQLKPKNYAHT